MPIDLGQIHLPTKVMESFMFKFAQKSMSNVHLWYHQTQCYKLG